MLLRLAVIWILFCFPAILRAQPSQILFDHYGTEAGFNSREAKDITCTEDGLVWISSNDGLGR